MNLSRINGTHIHFDYMYSHFNNNNFGLLSFLVNRTEAYHAHNIRTVSVL